MEQYISAMDALTDSRTQAGLPKLKFAEAPPRRDLGNARASMPPPPNLDAALRQPSTASQIGFASSENMDPSENDALYKLAPGTTASASSSGIMNWSGTPTPLQRVSRTTGPANPTSVKTPLSLSQILISVPRSSEHNITRELLNIINRIYRWFSITDEAEAALRIVSFQKVSIDRSIELRLRLLILLSRCALHICAICSSAARPGDQCEGSGSWRGLGQGLERLSGCENYESANHGRDTLLSVKSVVMPQHMAFGIYRFFSNTYSLIMKVYGIYDRAFESALLEMPQLKHGTQNYGKHTW